MKNLNLLNLKGLYGYRQSLLSRSPQPRDNQEKTERRPSEERTLLAPVPQRFFRYAVILIMLLTLGVGQIWADTKRIYFDVSNLSSWWTNDGYTAYIHIGNGTGTTTWPGAEMTSAGSNVYYYDINTNVTQIVFCRAKNGSYDNSNQTHDINPSSNNYFKIKANKEDNKYHADYSTTTVAGGYVYFDAYSSSWGTPGDVQLFVGHNSYSAKTDMSSISNTKLWYVTAPIWSDATEFAFTNGCSGWNPESNSYTSRIGSNTYKSGTKTSYNLNAGCVYMFKVASTANKAAVNSDSPYGYKGLATSSLNSTQTIKYAVSINGATATELTSGTVPATISMSSYKFEDGTYNAVSSSTASNTLTAGGSNYSATISAAPTATTVYTVSSLNSEYSFQGWYDAASGGTQLSEEMTYTDYPTSAKTVYARFSKENNHVVTISRHCTSTNTEINNTSATVGEVTYSSISAPVIEGYSFVNWIVGNGLSVKTGDSESSNPINVITLSTGSHTLQANYTEVLSTDWKLIGDNTTGSPFGDSYSYSSGKAMSKKTGYSATNKAYKTLDITKTGDFGFKVATAAGNATEYGWGTGDGDYVTYNRSYSGTKHDVYTGSQHELKFVPDALGEYEFEVDYTATPCSVKVTFPATTYTVNFGYREGGSSITATYGGTSFSSGTKVQSGKSVTFTQSAASGYEFAGWYNAESGGSKISDATSFTTTISEATYVYAAFTPRTYTNVTLDKNTGSTDGAYSVTYLDNKITVTTTPAKTGYHVDGYYAEAGTTTHIATAAGALQSGKSGYTDGSGRWNQAGGKKLYTKWAANTYTAENNIDGDGGSNGKYTATYDATSIAINTAPTRTGYNLTGYHAYGRGANTLANTAGALGASQSENKTGGKTLTNSSSQWIYDGSDATIYADWSPKTYSISLDQEGGASGSTSVTMTYDASTHTAITNPSKTGYTFAGYWTGDDGTGSMVIATDGTMQANVSTYTGDGGIWKKDATCTLYAKWTPNDYTVTLSTTGETGYGSGAPDNQTATYGAAMPTITPPVGAPGYKFMGYFTGHNGGGTKYYNADGSSARTWNIDDDTDLYAHFQKTVISSLEHPEAVATGETVYVVVNPVLNQEGAQPNMKICWSLLYDNDNPVESGWSVESYTEGGTKQNQVRFTLTGMSSGYYKIQAVLYANSSVMTTCDDGTELSTIKSDLRIAGNSKVTIQYEDASGNTIAAATSVEVARGDSIGVKAPTIVGYSFSSWTLGDVLTNTCADGSSCGTAKDSINIKAEYDGVLIANYTKKNMIYFNNTVGWDTVYVYFYSSNKYLDDDKGTGANSDKEISSAKAFWYHMWGGMTRIGSSNIYYLDYEDSITNASWQTEVRTYTNVAFTKDPQGYVSEGNKGYEFFYATEAVRREDFDHDLSMYVPLTDPTENKNIDGDNKTIYYTQGYWMNYPDNSGYVLKVWDNRTDGALRDSLVFPFNADKKMPMSITVDLEGSKTYGFKISDANGTVYGNAGEMTNGHSGDGNQGVWEFKSSVSTKAGLTTTSAGDYTFTLNYGLDIAATPGYNLLVGVHYPEATGDFRVQYKDNDHTTWKTSVVIPAGTEVDTVSYFVRKDESPYIRVQKCTATYDEKRDPKTVVEWNNENSGADILPDTISADGVYNFIFTKSDGALVLSKVEPYTGNFYIRVDGAGSTNWDNYRASDHLMPFSEYSFKQTTDPYSHYFTKYYDTSGGAKNIKFVVANDYSTNVSDTIIRDGIADSYVDSYGWLSGRNANIRFMYNYKTNVATRRYLDDAQGDNSANFLNLLAQEKDGIYSTADDETAETNIQFDDKGDWIYEKTVYAVPGARYKLRAQFGKEPGTVITQYFKGGAGSTAADSATLIGGSGSRLPIRIIYDFKTNRIVTAYQPASGTIEGNLEINADIMFMREHQGDIQQITFAPDNSISKIENIYCGLRFNKWTLNNKSKAEGHATLSPLLSRYERDIFYVSFPYDVRLSDVIGFGTYGQHWIVEYYDGAARAKNGFWIDSESYWKFVTPAMKDTFTLKAGTGYIVALDLDELYYIDGSHHADIWNNTETNDVELLFPGKVSSISNVNVTYNMPSHECKINRGTASGNRTIKDSHWNVLGVPTFKNITGAASEDGGGSGEIRFANVALLDTLVNDLKFIYDGNLADNSLTPKAVKDFEFKAMHAYVVQYCGDVTFTTSATPAPASVAARTYAEEPIDVDFRLELNKDGVVEDQTFVSMTNNEDASADFQFGEDLSKEFNSNRANIYTFIGTEWVAGNTLPMTNQTTIVPVGVKIAADGEYTFSIPEGTYGVGITLIDNETGARVNLGLMDYTVTLAAGQIDDRFVLEISPISQISTGVELLNGENGENGVRKVLIDNILYIVKDGKVFDAQGRRL